MDIINLNDKKKKLRIVNPNTYKVRINYFNVKYLEEAPGNKTKVHFIDKTFLLINKPLEVAAKDMDNKLKQR